MTKNIRIHLLDLAHTHSVGVTSMLVPLGCAYIKAYLVQQLGEEVEVKIFKDPEKALSAAIDDKPHIIGMANYVWNRQLNLKIGQYLKEKLPDTMFVAGGPNIDIDDEPRMAFLRKFDFLDFVVTNSGEEPFFELVEWWRDNRGDTTRLPRNIVWLEGEQVKATPERPPTKSVEGIPSPYLEGYLDEFIDAGMIPLFETNRGCPFSCSFCAWGMAAQSVVRKFELDRALEEIDYVGNRSNAVYWIVCDANFGMLKRDIEIAKKIRSIKDKKGLPEKCHVWLAKNVTERNLEIGSILGDMVVPVMAVQSLNDEVLKNIKRGNISMDTYTSYQKKFREMGSLTYSDVIIPLPGETLKSHIDGIHQLFEMGVDRIQNHNTWLLPGTEINSREIWEKYNFRTRRRLIHGDEGIYRAPDETEIRIFEYEESLRQTSTMSEEDMFYLRKFHFLVDFCWSLNVYKPLLKFCLDNGISPNEIISKLIDIKSLEGKISEGAYKRMLGFWQRFDKASHDEWFDTDEEIENFFEKEENFQRLINQEFEKLHIQFSVVIFKEFKEDFDIVIADIAKNLLPDEAEFIDDLMQLVSKFFPSLDANEHEYDVTVTDNFLKHGWLNLALGKGYRGEDIIRFVEGEKRLKAHKIIHGSTGKTLSKVLNTSNISMRELQYTIVPSNDLAEQLRIRLKF